MNNKNLATGFWQVYSKLVLLCSLLVMAPFSLASLTPMSDEDLGEMHAQGLFWTDKITGTELTGPNAYSSPFTFYRVGLQGEMLLNANIAKLQLGCGGVNDFLDPVAGCDMDLENTRFMGRVGNEIGDPKSAFKLVNPYFEWAVKNDGNDLNREVAGWKVGAALVDGGLSVGRRYPQGSNQINQENMDANVCGNSTGSIGSGNGALGCHSGINAISGFLGLEASWTMRLRGTINAFLPIGIDAWGCTGRTTFTGDDCGTGKGDALFVDAAGTRLTQVGLRAALLKLNDGGILTDIIGDVYASIDVDLRMLHQVTFQNTKDFYFSFQREPIAYPSYSKNSPTQEMIDNGTYASAFDSCATTNFNTARCNSAYSVPANTGWWMNAPSVKLLDVYNPNVNVGTLSVGEATALFGAPGLLMVQPELELTPAKNCYGTSRFC